MVDEIALFAHLLLRRGKRRIIFRNRNALFSLFFLSSWLYVIPDKTSCPLLDFVFSSLSITLTFITRNYSLSMLINAAQNDDRGNTFARPRNIQCGKLSIIKNPDNDPNLLIFFCGQAKVTFL